MAAAIAEKFKTSCSRQDINFWKSKNPPFPATRSDGKYNQKECFDWFAKHIAPSRPIDGESSGELFQRAARAKAEEQITKAAHAKLELEEAEGRLIDKSIARLSTISAAKDYHALVRREIEQVTPAGRRDKLQELGAPPEITALFHEFDLSQARGVIDRIERACAKAAKG